MTEKIFVTMPIPEETLGLLKQHFNVDINEEDELLSKQEIISRAKDADGIFCLLTDKIDKEVIDSLGNIKIISQCAVGFDNVDVSAASEKNIVVTNTPGVLTDTTADFAFTLLMAQSLFLSSSLCLEMLKLQSFFLQQ